MPSIAGINFLESTLSPFIQVKAQYRLRFSKGMLGQRAFNAMVDQLFSPVLDAAFMLNNVEGRYKPFHLHRYINITNWSHLDVVEEGPLSVHLNFAGVKGINKKDLKRYFIGWNRKKHMPAVSYFYNDTTLIRLSPLFIDIISVDTDWIAQLKDDYQPLYDTRYEQLNPVSIEEWQKK